MEKLLAVSSGLDCGLRRAALIHVMTAEFGGLHLLESSSGSIFLFSDIMAPFERIRTAKNKLNRKASELLHELESELREKIAALEEAKSAPSSSSVAWEPFVIFLVVVLLFAVSAYMLYRIRSKLEACCTLLAVTACFEAMWDWVQNITCPCACPWLSGPPSDPPADVPEDIELQVVPPVPPKPPVEETQRQRQPREVPGGDTRLGRSHSLGDVDYHLRHPVGIAPTAPPLRDADEVSRFTSSSSDSHRSTVNLRDELRQVGEGAGGLLGSYSVDVAAGLSYVSAAMMARSQERLDMYKT